MFWRAEWSIKYLECVNEAVKVTYFGVLRLGMGNQPKLNRNTCALQGQTWLPNIAKKQGVCLTYVSVRSAVQYRKVTFIRCWV